MIFVEIMAFVPERCKGVDLRSTGRHVLAGSNPVECRFYSFYVTVTLLVVIFVAPISRSRSVFETLFFSLFDRTLCPHSPLLVLWWSLIPGSETTGILDKSWTLMTRILGREGADLRISRLFFKVVVQAVLLFGSEMLFLTPCVERSW